MIAALQVSGGKLVWDKKNLYEVENLPYHQNVVAVPWVPSLRKCHDGTRAESSRDDRGPDARVGLPCPDVSLVPSDGQKKQVGPIADRTGGADLTGDGAAGGREADRIRA